MTTKWVNLTPHEVKVLDNDGNVILTVPPSGKVARVSTTEVFTGEIGNIKLFRVTYGEIQDLPAPEPNTIYIVSSIVLMALKEKGIKRTDVVSPNTNPSINGAVRDAKGQIIGVKSFITL
ncbi:MAG: hypothetical protein JHC26_01440 [Thermofilum sp.]|jgi:hypothetical protein|uniref:hypothetical protein n=1 Tax=Thermofilum sp. TaxID=1961369 RepID=UPI00258B66A5|nr:hypothetical protein [Thermofilum sp.]MCI4407724.1 hypothetical protein [Thermofilum sp.]